MEFFVYIFSVAVFIFAFVIDSIELRDNKFFIVYLCFNLSSQLVVNFFFKYRKTPLLVPGVGHFSTANLTNWKNTCDQKQNIF